MRILFMGTPDFAVASLRRLVEDGHELCGVLTQPDKPKNRGHKLMPTPVKEYALTKNLAVFQPVTLRNAESLELVRSLKPELIVVAAYGKLLPEDILNVPPLGSINVHSSLLPKYRGAAPINWAVLNGETETGVSIMYMAKELDAGDVILQKSTPIGDCLGASGAGPPAGGGAGGGGPVRNRQGLGGGNGRPHAPGPREAHLRPHAGEGALSRGLDPLRP